MHSRIGNAIIVNRAFFTLYNKGSVDEFHPTNLGRKSQLQELR